MKLSFYRQLKSIVGWARDYQTYLWLLTLMGLFLLGLSSSMVATTPDLANDSNPADQLPPTEHTAIGALADSNPRVSGYPSASSVVQGGSIKFHISTASNNLPYTIRISREAANGRKLMKLVENQVGKTHPCQLPGLTIDDDLSQTPDCNWPSAYTLNIPLDWPSGIYVADLLDEDDGKDGYGSYIFFVVKEDQPASTSDILFLAPTTTWYAYNDYGGVGLYTSPLGIKTTFNRPFLPCSTCQYRWEVPMIRWLEREGYTVEYVASEDLHTDPTLFFKYRLFMSVGHDEYWTKEMRDGLDSFIDAGGNYAVFSGNTMYRQVRFEDNLRTLVGYKSLWEQDPFLNIDPLRVSTDFDNVVAPNWPQNSTIGLGWTGFINNEVGDPPGQFTVYNTSHWAFAGTNLKDGDQFWYQPEKRVEVDGTAVTWSGGKPFVTGENQTPLNFQVLGIGPASRGNTIMGTFTRPGGGTVFNIGSFGWTHGLLPENNADSAIVSQITRNILDKLTANAPPPPPPITGIDSVSFTYTPTVHQNVQTSFTAIINPSSASTPITYIWNFGDGTAPMTALVDTPSTTHTYPIAGTFTVSLTAKNASSEQSVSKIIVIIPEGEPLPKLKVYLPIINRP